MRLSKKLFWNVSVCSPARTARCRRPTPIFIVDSPDRNNENGHKLDAMMVLQLLPITVLSISSVVSLVSAWETDQRCLDLYRDLREGGAPEKDGDDVSATSLAVVLDEPKPRNLRHRQLQVQKDYIFQIKMHWEEGYCVSVLNCRFIFAILMQ